MCIRDRELAELETENRRLEKQLEEAEKRLLKLEAEAEQLREEKEQEILDRKPLQKYWRTPTGMRI